MADRRRGRPRWLLGTSVAAVAILVLGAGYAAARSTSDGGSTYRVATVGRGPVEQVVSLVGTAQPLNEVTAAFPTSGNVTAVNVTVGQHVTAGQTLASLDTTGLTASLLAAQASLAQDRATLAADESASTSSAGSGATSGAVAASGSSPTSGSGGAGSSAPRASTGGAATGGSGSRSGSGAVGRTAGGSGSSMTVPPLDTAAAQHAVVSASNAMRDSQTICEPVLGTAQAGPTGSGTAQFGSHAGTNASFFVASSTGTPTPTTAATPTDPSPTDQPSQTSSTTTVPPSPAPTTAPSSPPPTSTPPPPTGTGTPSPTPVGSGSTPSVAEIRACVAALVTVRDAQQQAESALSRLSGDLARVMSAIAKAAAAASGSTGAASGGTSGSARTTTTTAAGTSAGVGAAGSGSVSRGGTSVGASGGQAGGSTSPTLRVAADQVAILQDQAAVTVAQADLTGATLKAPISGVVGQEALIEGQSASTAAGIVIVGPGAAQVTVNVPLNDMSLVRPGLSAQVTPAGGTTASAGSVSSVSLLPTATSGTTPSYPARVDVADPPASMAAGSTVTVSIKVASVPAAVRVPVSALSGVTARGGTVTLLSGSTTTTARVEVGAIGGGWAEVLGGLSTGQQVVLADPSAPLPSNSFPGLRGLGGGGGGFGGGVGFNRGTSGGSASTRD